MGKQNYFVANSIVSWVGLTDMGAWARSVGHDELSNIRARYPKLTDANLKAKNGPLRACLEHMDFDEAHLLLRDGQEIETGLIDWFAESGTKIIPHHADITGVMDWESIYDQSAKVFAQLTEVPELWVNLSSGTQAMQSTLLMLGKSRLPNECRFLTSHVTKIDTEPTVLEPLIPLNLKVDFLPAVIGQQIDSQLALYEFAIRCGDDRLKEFDDIVGKSKSINRAKGLAVAAAKTDCNVLLLGETGVGKEMFAHAIHNSSRRATKPFVEINCAEFEDELLRSELFGHEKGAFTGADTRKDGLMLRANGGSIFLDEFGECSDKVQQKLLRALNPPHGSSQTTRQFRRLGGTDNLESDVRIILATNRDLREMRRKGKLREDLYQRISEVPIQIPPLRERVEDIILIAEALLKNKISPANGRNMMLNDEAKSVLLQEDWRGNVRQLQNKLSFAAVLTLDTDVICGQIMRDLLEQDRIIQDYVGFNNISIGNGFDIKQFLDTTHAELLQQAYIQSNKSQAEAARLLGLNSPQTFRAQYMAKVGDL